MVTHHFMISRLPEATMTTVTYPSTKGYRTLRLSLPRYGSDDFVSDNACAKERLEELYSHPPDLFPEDFAHGSVLYGSTPVSAKLDVRCRRLRLAANDGVYTVAPGFVMPSLSGDVDDVSHAWFLMRFHVPCWAIAHVFGRDGMSWYRLEPGLGRFSVVGTTVRSPEHLPHNVVADAKHSWRKGERVYGATTASEGCLLGASVAPSASQPELMRYIDRAFFKSQYVHGTGDAAERRARALALLGNFCPSSPRTVKKYHGQRCPAERLNGKRYTSNCLENLVVSGSMNGYRRYQQKTL
jgi:hypothetical protein